MKASTISELKQELTNIPHSQLLEICLRLARFKKENKELLTYLLFEAHDEQAYIQQIKDEIEKEFQQVNDSNLYFAKKTIRKILRITTKYIRYSGSKTVEIESLILFCTQLKDSGIAFEKSTVLVNLYNGQIKKITTAIQGLHEDLQYEYLRDLKKLIG